MQQTPSPGRAHVVYDLMLRGCKLVSKWTAMVLEQVGRRRTVWGSSRAAAQSAWKFSNPTDPYSNPDCPDKASDYEKVVRYNYNSSERFALVEYISMIKSVKSMLSNSCASVRTRARAGAQACPFRAWRLRPGAQVCEIVAQHVYTQLQTFLATTFAEIVAHASKKKKAILNALLQVRGAPVRPRPRSAGAAWRRRRARRSRIWWRT